MRKYFVLILPALFVAMAGCDKKDPILPGVRVPVFHNNLEMKESKATAAELMGKEKGNRTKGEAEQLYEMSENNILTRKSDGRVILRGFPTATKAGPAAEPIVSGNFIYAGLSTGEVLKIRRANGEIIWTVDLGGRSLLTGGSLLSDISVMKLDGNFLYVSGVGGTFGKLRSTTGEAVWVSGVGTMNEIFISGNLIAFVDLDGRLVMLDARDGSLVEARELSKRERKRSIGELVGR